MKNSKENILNPKKWVELYADYLFNFAFLRVNDDHIANDLVQETFLAALKSLKNFKGEATEKTWLTSILKRKVIDHYRRKNSKKGQREMSVNFYLSGENKGNWIEEKIPQDWNSSFEKNIENEELKQQLLNCIGKLPKKHEIVFRMKTIENISTEEICKELNISSSNLWVIIHRARTQLRECLENNWFKK